MSTETLLIIVVLVLLLGGGGFFWSRRGRWLLINYSSPRVRRVRPLKVPGANRSEVLITFGRQD